MDSGCPPRKHGAGSAKEGGERSERALATVALAEVGGCFLVFESNQNAVTKEQPPLSSSTPSPPSQEGSFSPPTEKSEYQDRQDQVYDL